MSTTNGTAQPPPVPINTAGRNVGKVNARGLLRQVVAEERAAGREPEPEKVLAVARKRVAHLPPEQQAMKTLNREEVLRALRGTYDKGPAPVPRSVEPPTAEAYTPTQLLAARDLLASCRGDQRRAAGALELLSRLNDTVIPSSGGPRP